MTYIEEREGKLSAIEFKWTPRVIKAPKDFEKAYPESSFQVIDKTNYWEFLTPVAN